MIVAVAVHVAIRLHMLFRQVDMDSEYPAVKVAEISFRCIRVDVAAHILPGAMPDGTVFVSRLRNVVIAPPFVRHDL